MFNKLYVYFNTHSYYSMFNEVLHILIHIFKVFCFIHDSSDFN